MLFDLRLYLATGLENVRAVWDNESGPEGALTPESPGLTCITRHNRGARLMPTLNPPSQGVNTPPTSGPSPTKDVTR